MRSKAAAAVIVTAAALTTTAGVALAGGGAKVLTGRRARCALNPNPVASEESITATAHVKGVAAG